LTDSGHPSALQALHRAAIAVPTLGTLERISRPSAIARTRTASTPISAATFFNKIKQCRRGATRYDKLLANDLAYVKLTCIPLAARL